LDRVGIAFFPFPSPDFCATPGKKKKKKSYSDPQVYGETVYNGINITIILSLVMVNIFV
jgi:hypothetical protein